MSRNVRARGAMINKHVYFDFDGESTGLTYDIGSYDLSNAFSIVAVAQLPSGVSTAAGTIVGNRTGTAGANEVRLATNGDGDVVFAVESSSSTTDAVVFDDNDWHVVAGVFDGTEGTAAARYQVFVDGADPAQTASGSDTDIASGSLDWGIGVDADGTGENTNLNVRAVIVLAGAITAARSLEIGRLIASPNWQYAQNSISNSIIFHVQPGYASNSLDQLGPGVFARCYATDTAPTEVGTVPIGFFNANL